MAVLATITKSPALLKAGLLAVTYGVAAVSLLLLFGLFVRHEAFAFDRALLGGLRETADPSVPVGPRGLLVFMRDLTALGSGNVLTLAVVVVAGLLVALRRWAVCGLLAASTLSGGLLVDWIKLQVARPRPDVVPHLTDVHNLSFPSGHSANSAIVYLILAGLAVRATREGRARMYTFACAVVLVALIGGSRVYLGVHWPSDVLAGWSFGALWAAGWLTLVAAVDPAVGRRPI